MPPHAPPPDAQAPEPEATFRLLFLSDTHLGLDLPARPRVERPRRGDDFFRAYEQALAPARAGEVDAVLHGGDLLYRSRVPARLAEAALAPLRRLAEAGVPVLLVPGNHERARIPYPLLARHGALHVFDRPRTVVLEARGLRVAFGGFPYAPAVRARFRDLLGETGLAAADADVRLLCLHHCVEGATCGLGGPGLRDFTFRDGEDVVRRADLPSDVAAVLCGHVHRAQVLRAPGRPPVVYPGSVERTSFAEAGEPKGTARLTLGARGLAAVTFHPLPTRPMRVRALALDGLGPDEARARLEEALAATPAGASVQLRLDGAVPAEVAPLLGAAALRALAGARQVVVAWRSPPGRARPDRRRGPARAGPQNSG